VLGVGLASNLVLRHIVQTAPLWVAVVLGFRRSHAAPWVALPFFLFWLLLMALIWAYLLGISTFFSGHFSPVEIAMTFIVGAASMVGIGCFVAFKTDLSWGARIGLFDSAFCLQSRIAEGRGRTRSLRMKGRRPLLLLSILVCFSTSCETGTFDPWLSPTQMEVEGECDVFTGRIVADDWAGRPITTKHGVRYRASTILLRFARQLSGMI